MCNHGVAAGLEREPRRRWVRGARAAYLAIERSSLAPLLRLPSVQRLKARVTYMPAEQVLALLGVLDAAGVRVWVAGGWGVDALAGHQTRRHYDLDLLIGDEPGEYDRVAGVLAGNGFRAVASERTPGLPMPWRHAWQDNHGYSVEVLPVALGDPPFGWPAAGPATFTTGTIEGRPVPCLSAALQLTLHAGYPARDIDTADTGVLRGCLGGQGTV